MPFVPVTERSQAMTTGINGQLKLGRTPGTLTEYDVKNAKLTQRFANQDKTGSFGEGYEDSEVGVIGWDISGDLINHIDAPINFHDPNNKWYAEYVVDGHGTVVGFFRFKSNDNGFAANGDHTLSFSGSSCIGLDGATRVKPSFTAYSA
jgi:hypothetical protein